MEEVQQLKEFQQHKLINLQGVKALNQANTQLVTFRKQSVEYSSAGKDQSKFTDGLMVGGTAIQQPTAKSPLVIMGLSEQQYSLRESIGSGTGDGAAARSYRFMMSSKLDRLNQHKMCSIMHSGGNSPAKQNGERMSPITKQRFNELEVITSSVKIPNADESYTGTGSAFYMNKSTFYRRASNASKANEQKLWQPVLGAKPTINQDLVMVKTHNQDTYQKALKNFNPMEINMEVSLVDAQNQTRERLEGTSGRTSVCYKPSGIEYSQKRVQLQPDMLIESGAQNMTKVDILSYSPNSQHRIQKSTERESLYRQSVTSIHKKGLFKLPLDHDGDGMKDSRSQTMTHKGLKSSQDLIQMDEQYINTKERDASNEKEQSQDKNQNQVLNSHQSEGSASEFEYNRRAINGRQPISFSNHDNSPNLRKQINEKHFQIQVKQTDQKEVLLNEQIQLFRPLPKNAPSPPQMSITESQICKGLFDQVEDNIKVRSFGKTNKISNISQRQNKMSQQHRRNNLTKIERMNQINRFSRVAETKLESIINVSQRSSPSRGMGTNSFRQKRQTLAKPQRIAKYEKDHKGSKSALQVLSSRVKNLNQIKNDQLLISGREKEWIAQYGTDYNQKLLEYYTLKSNESNILIEQELYQIENYYRQLQTAQGRTSTNSKEEKSGLVAASNDAWSNVNVDQDLSKMSTEEKDISQEPSLQKAIQQASSWPHVPQQQANIQKEGSKEAQHENKAEWKVLDLSKVIKTQCSEPAAIERPKTSDDFQKELAFQILGQQYKIQTLLQEKKLIDDQVKRLKLQQVNRGRYSPPNSKQGHYITQHTNCANPTSRLSNKYEHQISNDESPFRPSHQGLESPATAQLSPELRHQFEPKMLHINLQQMDQSPLNDRSKVSPGVSKFSPREKQTELMLSLRLDEQSTLVIGGGATERGMKNQSKTIKKSESPKPRQSNRSKKDTSQINKDIQNILPGHTGGLLEAIAFEQLIAHGVEPVTPAPQMVEKQLLSISPPIESDEEMVVLVQTKRIAAAQINNSAPETIHPLPTPSKENQDNHTNDKNRNTPGLIQVRDARDSTCLVPREKGSFESTYGAGSAVEVGQINNLPFQSQQMDLQQVLNTFDSNNSNEPSFARVQAIPTPNQKIKIKIEVSQERGNEMWTAEKPKDQDSGRNTGQSIIESIANSQKSTIVANPTQTISPSRLSNGKQFWPIKSKELSLTGNGIPQNQRSPRKLDNATQDKKVDEQIQTVDPTQRSQMRAIQVKQDSQRSQGRQDSQPSQGRYTSQSIGKDQPESQIPTSKNVAGIFQQIRNMDSRQVTYSRIVTQRNKDKFLLSKSTDAPQSTDRNGSPRQMEPQFAQESQRYRQPTIPQAQNRQPYNSQLQNIGNIMQVNSLMGQNLVEAETSGRNTRSFGLVAQISQHSPRSIMGEPHYRDKNRFLEELPEMIKRRQQEQLQKFKHFERRSQIEPNMKDLFNQFHEFQDSNNILRESNPMFEVAPTPKNPLTSKKMNQHINISIQGHQRNPTREGMSLGKVETIKFAHSNEKPWTVATAQPGHGRLKRVRGQLKPLDPINDLLSVSACFSTNNQRGTALSGQRKDLNNFERETRSHLEDRQRLEIGTELPFTPLARLGETSQGFYTSKPSGMRKSHQFGQLRQSNLFSSKQSPRNATAGLTAFQKSIGLQGISPRTGDAKSSLKDETFTRKNRIGVSQRREKNRAIKNQRNYAAKQIRPEQIAKGYRLSSRVMNTDKFNHHAQKMIIQHDQIMQQASLPVEQAENPSNSETNYEFKVNGRYQKIIKKGEKFETPQFPNDGQIKVVDQIQIGEAALGQNGINKLSDEFDTATAQNALSKNGLPVHHLQNNSVNKPIQTGDVTPEARSSVLLRPLPKLPQGLQDARVESQLGQSSGAPLDDAQGRPDVRRLLNTSNGCVESVKSEKGESLMDKEMLRAQQRTGVPGPRSRYGVNLESPSRILEADFKNEDIAQQLRDSPIMLDHGSAFSPSQTAQPTVKTVYTLHGGRKIEDQAAKQSRLESQLNNKSKPSIGPQDAQALSVSNGGSQSGASQAIGITKISQISHSVLAEQRALASRESKRYVTQQSQVVGRERQLPSNEASSLITNDNLRKLQCKSRDGARGFKHLGVFQDGASSRLKPANQDLPKEVQEQIQ